MEEDQETTTIIAMEEEEGGGKDQQEKFVRLVQLSLKSSVRLMEATAWKAASVLGATTQTTSVLGERTSNVVCQLLSRSQSV